MRFILTEKNFDTDRDLLLIKKRKKHKTEFSTDYTLLSLNYDRFDIVERLKALTLEDYSHTLFDYQDVDPPLLFVFGKDICAREVYIKIKIRCRDACSQVICVSFHYAEHPLNHPYQCNDRV